MALLKIARMGQPVLRQVADPVPLPISAEVRRLAANMVETMLDAPGIGLAAPQVYVPLRLIVVSSPTPSGGMAPTVLVNPTATPLGTEEEEYWEGCLSIPGLRGPVLRPRRVQFSALNLEGEPVGGEAEGLHARVIQHELDHLDGVLYLDRLSDLRRLAFETELRPQAASAGSAA